MKRIFNIALLLAAVLTVFASCEENLDENTEYDDWQNRNAAYFSQVYAQADEAIKVAQAQYGNSWEDHCPWRIIQTYAVPDTAKVEMTDNVVVYIQERGTGSGCPLYTDSASVDYIGRLMPNALSEQEESRTKGYTFDHSGVSRDSADVFSPTLSTPVMFKVSAMVEGFTTVLMKMHIGDQWRVYIPQELGYGSASTTDIPAYSTLIFDMRLRAYYRIGVIPGQKS